VKLRLVEAVIWKLTERGTPKFTGQSLLVRRSVSSMHSPDGSGSSFVMVRPQLPARAAGTPQASGSGEGTGDGLGEGDGDGDADGDGLGEGEGLGVGEGVGDGVGDGPGSGDGAGLGSGNVPVTRTSTVAVADDVPARAVSW
jgi:hypothetical protein